MSLHPLAQDALYRLTAPIEDRGRLERFFVRFWNRLEELDRLARREHRRPIAQDDLERLDEPLEVGGVALRRPSVGARNWLAEHAARWWGMKDGGQGSPRLFALAVAWAEAQRDAAAFDGARTRAGAWLRIRVWALKVRGSEEALRRAALALLPPPEDSLKWFEEPGDDDDDPEKPDLMGLALALAEKYGGTPGEWLWEKAEDDFWGAVCGLADAAEAAGDPQHDDPSGWWRRHRKAVVRCEQALEADVREWLAAEDAAEAADKARREVRGPLDADAPDACNESGLKVDGDGRSSGGVENA